MNEKQRVMLEGLYKLETGSEESFRAHYEEFVELEITKLDRISVGFLIRDDLRKWIHVDRVLEYFILIARARKITESMLTIEQMLHLMIIDLLIWEYRYWPSIGLDLESLAKVRAA